MALGATPQATKLQGKYGPLPTLKGSVSAAMMVPDERENNDLVVLFEVTVTVGGREVHGGARRRYREFHMLRMHLMQRYPHLLGMDNRDMPPFPRKHFFRAGWDPCVVMERVAKLDTWLGAVCERLQFSCSALVAFLNVPIYAAIRLLSGDLQPDDFVEPCSPASVVAIEQELLGVVGVGGKADVAFSPQPDRRSMARLAERLPFSVSKPSYTESAFFVARAICSSARDAGVAQPPSLEEAQRFVRTVCGRAMFKPASLIATVVYMERLGSSKLGELLRGDGWRLVGLVLLVISAKVWDSDYPIANSDICSPSALSALDSPATLPHERAERQLSPRRVNDCERRVLGLLDFCTVISQAEFTRYYFTLPFVSPRLPVAALGDRSPVGRSSTPLVPAQGGGDQSSVLVEHPTSLPPLSLPASLVDDGGVIARSDVPACVHGGGGDADTEGAGTLVGSLHGALFCPAVI